MIFQKINGFEKEHPCFWSKKSENQKKQECSAINNHLTKSFFLPNIKIRLHVGEKMYKYSSPSDRFSKALLRIAGTQPTGAPTSDSHPTYIYILIPIGNLTKMNAEKMCRTKNGLASRFMNRF